MEYARHFKFLVCARNFDETDLEGAITRHPARGREAGILDDPVLGGMLPSGDQPHLSPRPWTTSLFAL